VSRLSKFKNAGLGLLLAPFYVIIKRERDRKLRDRLARSEEKQRVH
jgi:hypothetical protein